jgi:hypothetical protein
LIAAPAQAEDNHNYGIGFSNKNLLRSSFSAGRTGVEIFAESQVDVARLVAEVDLAKDASSQGIADRINAARKRLYPREEIILSIAPAQGLPGDKASLVKAIYWWNNTNCSTCYWYAQYTSATATLFTDDIQYGAYNIYDRVGTGGWVFRTSIGAGGAVTRYSVGSKTTRGFKGASAGISSKADVVMYFFN